MGSYWIDAKWLKQSIWNTIKNATTDQCTSISYKTLQTARLLLLQLLLVVVNIIRVLSDSPRPYNEKHNKKQQSKDKNQSPSALQNKKKHVCLHVTIYFSNDEQKNIKYIKDMKWNDP